MIGEKAPLFKKIYEEIIDKVNVGIHAIDSTGMTIIYNKKMSEIESMDIEEVLNKNIRDVFIFKEEQDSTLVNALQKGKEVVNVKQTYFNNKGKEITTINNTFPLIIDGKIEGAIEIVSDVSQVERLIRNKFNLNQEATYTFENIIGESDCFKEVVELAKKTTRTSTNVLIVGETGTGKEMFAQSIHNEAVNKEAPFISQNCAEVSFEVLETLLFGATENKYNNSSACPGLFELAEGGTLYLEEINSMSLQMQAKLVRVLQEKKVSRIGEEIKIPTNVRVIATMNEDPIDAIANNRFRKDLFYRLAVVTIFLPPLRDRKDDLSKLIDYYIAKYNAFYGLSVQGVTSEVEELFSKYHWPGNVRELEQLIEYSIGGIVNEEKLQYNHLPFNFRNKIKKRANGEAEIVFESFLTNDKVELKEQLEEFERKYIIFQLQKNNLSISRTAEKLGLSRQSLQYRMKRLQISIQKLKKKE